MRPYLSVKFYVMAEKQTAIITKADFLQESGADKIVEELKLHFKDKPLIVSDVTDNTGHQYVDLVQEGGGVLGVALVGYTYVLEKLGLRFLKLAGTSAGAINTIMLASVDKKNRPEYSGFETKSEIILHEMLNYDLWRLVDG